MFSPGLTFPPRVGGVQLGPIPLFKGVGVLNDFRNGMPAGSTYTRTGAATGLTLAGLISSFAANNPQRTDRGLALEPARTNILVNSVWAGGTTPTGWISPATSAAASALFPSAVALTFAASASRVFTVFAATVTAATAYVVTVNVESVTGSITASQVLGSGLGSPITWPVCSANPTGDASGAVGVGRLVAVFTPAGTSEQFRFGAGVNNNQTATVVLSLPGAAAASTPTSPIPTTGAAATRGLPVFTEPVPGGRTKALLTYADTATTLVTGLTPGGTFDVATAVIGASKGRYGASELITREWQA